jgi:hypothetical protein
MYIISYDNFFVGRKCPILNYYLPGVCGKCGICIEREGGRKEGREGGGRGDF